MASVKGVTALWRGDAYSARAVAPPRSTTMSANAPVQSGFRTIGASSTYRVGADTANGRHADSDWNAWCPMPQALAKTGPPYPAQRPQDAFAGPEPHHASAPARMAGARGVRHAHGRRRVVGARPSPPLPAPSGQRGGQRDVLPGTIVGRILVNYQHRNEELVNFVSTCPQAGALCSPVLPRPRPRRER